jgi:hypothetical protein
LDQPAQESQADGTGVHVVLQAEVTSAAFSPDGLRIVTASLDNTARVWPVTTIPELQRMLREAFKDCLTPPMRRTYLDEPEAQAQERYEACERSYGRPPLFTAAP